MKSCSWVKGWQSLKRCCGWISHFLREVRFGTLSQMFSSFACNMKHLQLQAFLGGRADTLKDHIVLFHCSNWATHPMSEFVAGFGEERGSRVHSLHVFYPGSPTYWMMGPFPVTALTSLVALMTSQEEDAVMLLIKVGCSVKSTLGPLSFIVVLTSKRDHLPFEYGKWIWLSTAGLWTAEGGAMQA